MNTLVEVTCNHSLAPHLFGRDGLWCSRCGEQLTVRMPLQFQWDEEKTTEWLHAKCDEQGIGEKQPEA